MKRPELHANIFGKSERKPQRNLLKKSDKNPMKKMRITCGAAVAAGIILAASSRGQDGLPFSPFDFGQTFSAGLSLSYFHYNEEIDMSDEIRSFETRYGRTPEILGAPKSTEYGTEFGINAGGAFYSWRSRLFFRPRAELLIGISNTYDGSTQGEPVVGSPGDTTGIQFSSITGNKNNFFISAGGDFGYAIPFFKFPFVLYIGLDYLWWYRDLTMTQGNTYYFGASSNVETYSRVAVPTGILCVKPVSSVLAVGFDLRADWMFYGAMKNTVNTGSSDSTVYFPAVTLGNFPAFRMEFFAVKKINDGGAVKLSPYFLYYGFGKSNTAVSTITVSPGDAQPYKSFFEPDSKSFLVGCTVSLEFLKKRFR
jgi:hypothetical protein